MHAHACSQAAQGAPGAQPTLSSIRTASRIRPFNILRSRATSLTGIPEEQPEEQLQQLRGQLLEQQLQERRQSEQQPLAPHRLSQQGAPPPLRLTPPSGIPRRPPGSPGQTDGLSLPREPPTTLQGPPPRPPARTEQGPAPALPAAEAGEGGTPGALSTLPSVPVLRAPLPPHLGSKRGFGSARLRSTLAKPNRSSHSGLGAAAAAVMAAVAGHMDGGGLPGGFQEGTYGMEGRGGERGAAAAAAVAAGGQLGAGRGVEGGEGGSVPIEAPHAFGLHQQQRSMVRFSSSSEAVASLPVRQCGDLGVQVYEYV